MIWPYDDRCRLIGENVYEPDPDKVELFTLDRADVLTTEQSKQLHAPLITPLSSCERTQHRPLPVTRKWPIVLVGRQGLEPWTR
jgi:hypothetical protein